MDAGTGSVVPGRPVRVLWAVLAVALNLAVVYAPQAPSVAAGGFPLDKAVHAVVFALPVMALVAAGAPFTPTVAILAAHAPISEVVQQLVLPHRSGDPWDVLADLVGVGIGALAAHRWWRREPMPGRD